MIMNIESIRDKIKEDNASSKQQADKYEQLKCWSYAYLARWVVLEKGLKSLYNLYNRECIRKCAIEWLEYLDDKGKKPLNKINNFTIQTQSIPPYKFVKELLGECSSVKDALDSNSKYRRKRNSIAHQAEEFRSEKDYLGYREAIDKAIKQLLTKLSQKINAKK
jgi:hypothetical protein